MESNQLFSDHRVNPDDFAALFESVLAEYGVSADAERREYYFEAFFDHLDACHPEPYRMAMADLRETFDLEPSAEELAETYVDREAAATTLRPGVWEVLDALAESADPDCRLGVLTNLRSAKFPMFSTEEPELAREKARRGL